MTMDCDAFLAKKWFVLDANQSFVCGHSRFVHGHTVKTRLSLSVGNSLFNKVCQLNKLRNRKLFRAQGCKLRIGNKR